MESETNGSNASDAFIPTLYGFSDWREHPHNMHSVPSCGVVASPASLGAPTDAGTAAADEAAAALPRGAMSANNGCSTWQRLWPKQPRFTVA